VYIPAVIADAIARGAAVAVSVSSGKDSQAMERVLARLRHEQGWPGPFFGVHADVGSLFDWPWTLALAERNARAIGYPLYIVRRKDGRDLHGIVQHRVDVTSGSGKPPFPNMQCRFCTSDGKVGPIDVLLRRASQDLLICAVGLRAEESPGRAKQRAVTIRWDITTGKLKKLPREEQKKLTPEDALAMWQPGDGRLAFTWNPILHWDVHQVWQEIGTSQAELDARRDLFNLGCYGMAFAGWPAAPTYVMGFSRHSCAICCFSRQDEIRLAAKYKPALVRTIAEMEQESGFAWQQGKPVSAMLDIKPIPIPAEAYVIQTLPADYHQLEAGKYELPAFSLDANALALPV